MSLIVAYIGVDKPNRKNGIASMYFGADSRISWGPNAVEKCDSAQKIFYSTCFPEMFAYCGMVAFPQHVLPQLVRRIDTGTLVTAEMGSDEKLNYAVEFIQEHLGAYQPSGVKNDCIILYGTKHRSRYALYKITINGNNIRIEKVPLDYVSGVVCCEGSGAMEFKNQLSHVGNTNEANTTRGMYHCLLCTILNSKTPTVGGMMQVAGLYRGSQSPQELGIICQGERYVGGQRVEYAEALNNLEWRDESFQRVDPKTMTLLEGAQAQPFI